MSQFNLDPAALMGGGGVFQGAFPSLNYGSLLGGMQGAPDISQASPYLTQQAPISDPNVIDVGQTPPWQMGLGGGYGGGYGIYDPSTLLGGQGGYGGRGYGAGSLAGAYGGQMRPSQAGLQAQYGQQAQNYAAMLPVYNQMFGLAGANQALLQNQNQQQTAQQVGDLTQRLLSMGLGNTTVLPSMQQQAQNLGIMRGQNIAANAAAQQENVLGQKARAMGQYAPVQSPYLNQNAQQPAGNPFQAPWASMTPYGGYG